MTPSGLETSGQLRITVRDETGAVLNEKTFAQSTVLSKTE